MTDHRVGLTLHGLPGIMAGEVSSAGQGLDTLIDALIAREQVRQIEEMIQGDDAPSG